MAKAKDSGGDYARVERLLAEAGLTMPPMPEMAEARLKEREDDCFSTRTFKASPADLLHYVRKAFEGVSPDYVLVALGRDGRTADALHFFLVQGPLQLFLQIGRGGAGASRERATALVNGCFALAHQLVEAVPHALRKGRLAPTGRLTVVGSDLGESFWEVAQADERADRPSRRLRGKNRAAQGPREALEEAIRWCRE
jgi:hypothetical protein